MTILQTINNYIILIINITSLGGTITGARGKVRLTHKL